MHFRCVLALAALAAASADTAYESFKGDYQSQECCDGSGAARRSPLDGVKRTCADTRGIALEHCTTAFGYALMSGDPTHDGVVLMALLDPAAGATQVAYEVFSDAGASALVASGTVDVNAEFHNAKVALSGLAAGTHYWYRFANGDDVSSLARTKTLPQDADEVRTLEMSCSNAHYSLESYCKAAEVVAAEGTDFAIHLGDFTYEFTSKKQEWAEVYMVDEYYAIDPTFQVKNSGTPAMLGVPPDFVVTAAERAERVRTYLQDPCAKALYESVPVIMTAGDHDRINNHAAPAEVDPDWTKFGWHNDALHGPSETRIKEQNRAFYALSPTNRNGLLYPTAEEALQFREPVFDTGVAKFATVESRIHREGDLKDFNFILNKKDEYLALGSNITAKIAKAATDYYTVLASLDMDPSRKVFGDAQRQHLLDEMGSTPDDEWFVMLNPEPLGLSRDSILFSILVNLAGDGAADVTTEIVPMVAQLFGQLLAGGLLGEVDYITNERDGAAFAVGETQLVRDALNGRARGLSLGGDMHEYKARARTEGNAQVDEVVVPSLSMAMDSFKLQPWFPLLPAILASVKATLDAYGIPMAISPASTGEEIFDHLLDIIEGPAHVDGDRFDNGFVTTHFTRDAANHTAYLARGIRGIPNFPDPTNPTAWFMTYEMIHGRTWRTMSYVHTPASDVSPPPSPPDSPPLPSHPPPPSPPAGCVDDDATAVAASGGYDCATIAAYGQCGADAALPTVCACSCG